MMKDPELAKWAQADEWPIFMGNNRSLCAHPVNAKKEFAFQAYWPDEDSGPEAVGEDAWSDVVDVATLDYNNIGSNIKRVVDFAPQLVKTKWMKHEEVEYWSDESGRIVLVGEAAHPWFPGGTHGPAMALEDAVVLGTLFGHLKKPEQISAFVNAFQEIREDRTKVVNNVDVSTRSSCGCRLAGTRRARQQYTAIAQGLGRWDAEAGV
ncbi:hypothetical protein BC629DRAFT_902273 [Irpex lacteus]|nr:hypothetical protein BC629DRAFT_902273 [Irpex lacteus]